LKYFFKVIEIKCAINISEGNYRALIREHSYIVGTKLNVGKVILVLEVTNFSGMTTVLELNNPYLTPKTLIPHVLYSLVNGAGKINVCYTFLCNCCKTGSKDHLYMILMFTAYIFTYNG
jgi:hypothetical protein